MDYVTEQKQRVLMERQEPTFYSKMPKMAIMDLTPYELALYANYKQTAGESGGSWKSNKTLSKETKMSVRMVQECRKSLEEKGYIQCVYETNENGVVSSSVIVTIVDVWAENHKRFVHAHDAPPMHSVHTPHADSAYPHAHDAPKEEPYKKNQKKKDSSLPEDEQAMLALVKKELKQYGASATKITKLLMTRCVGKDADLNLSRAISQEEFRGFLAWWDKKKDRDGNKLARPSNIGSIHRNVQVWLDETTQAPAIVAQQQPVSNSMNAARMMALLAQEQDNGSK